MPFPFRSRQKKGIREALRNADLHRAIDKATSQHQQKFLRSEREIPWEEIKKKAQEIRKECVKILPELVDRFRTEAEKAGARTYFASTPEEALNAVEAILAGRQAKLVIKAKSMVSEEIGLNEYLERKGYQVVETDLGEWIMQLAGERPAHITAPALNKTKEQVAEILSRKLGKPVPPDIREIVSTARREMRRYFCEADVGVSGANLAIAESGTLALVSNEGNARLVTSLPPVHIVLVTVEKFVETMEQATTLLKALITASSGMKMTSYVSFLTGPSKTTDIEKELVIGVHGPAEMHIVILDNGRLAAAKDEDFEKTLHCLKCGGCLLVCPVFQAVGGYNFGGPVYPGGIGIALTSITRSEKDSFPWLALCADCKACEHFCPVSVPTGELLLKLKERKGPVAWEKALSALFGKKKVLEKGSRIMGYFQRLWLKNGYLRTLPSPWTKGKLIPALKPMKKGAAESSPGAKPSPADSTGENRKIYLFQGCLVRFFFPEVREGVIESLSHFGFEVVVPDAQVCCGAPSLHLGRKKDVEKLAQTNLVSFQKENPDIILTVCPTGNSLLKNLYPELVPGAALWKDRVMDFTEFMVKMGLPPEEKTGPGEATGKKVFYHHPCHSAHELKVEEEPIKLLRDLGYDPKAEDKPFSCCGFCGVFSFKNPEISSYLWQKKRKRLKESEASLIATDCPGCLFQLRAHLKKEGSPAQVFHTAELSAKSLRTS